MVERYQAILAAEAAELKKRLPEGKLADMFERCYLNTIDEAVKELDDGSLTDEAQTDDRETEDDE